MTEYTNTNQNAAMDWDDAIENDGREFIILPEGDYNFTVTGFERGRFPGSAKMSACNKAPSPCRYRQTTAWPSFTRISS